MDFRAPTRVQPACPDRLASFWLEPSPCSQTLLAPNHRPRRHVRLPEIAETIYFLQHNLTERYVQPMPRAQRVQHVHTSLQRAYQEVMWSKVSSALKLRTNALGQAGDDEPQSSRTGEVLASVYEQHPNLSVFHEPPEVPFPSPSPPASPSIHGRRSMFKRISKQVPPNNDSTEALPRISGPLKKVKSSINGPSTGASHVLFITCGSSDISVQLH